MLVSQRAFPILIACVCACAIAGASAIALRADSAHRADADADAGAAPGLRSVARVYVEPLPPKPGSEQLEKALIAQLRHVHDITVVPAVVAADAILHAEGEVWIKVYRSLNPRSGPSLSNGRPVYGGFLSVELRRVRGGETLWSDLASANATEDVYDALVKPIVKHLAEARQSPDDPAIVTDRTAPPVIMKGAGATFPAPIYRKWFAAYAHDNPGVTIAYEAVGSEEGMRRVVAGGVDFGACDHPAIFRGLAADRAGDYLLVPSVIGAVVPIVNLPGLAGEIALTPEALAGIYLGTITRWNDPQLRDANRGLPLPNLAITVIHRADGSGTSYRWTEYLAKASPAWQTSVGVSASPTWPTGQAATGNDGIATLVAQVPGAIGYVEFIDALHAHLGHARVRNHAGAFVSASLESLAAAVGPALASDDVTRALSDAISDPTSPTAYPMTSLTWLVIPTHVDDANKRAALTGFLHWMLTTGQRQAAALGYLALPRPLASKADAAISFIQ
jgi:phosphate ABC transporter phosphate-binding protein